MYLLDTDILIWILRNKTVIIEQISELKEKSALAISVVSVAEIFKNIFPTELTTTEDFLNQHIIFDVDLKMAKMAGLYWQQFHKQFSALSLADCIIAATANTQDLTLVSLNTKHFPMQDIKLLNPQ